MALAGPARRHVTLGATLPFATLSADERALLRKRLRTPVLTFLALAGPARRHVTLGATLPFA
ncbi:hypothetical protein CTI14_70450, partial [Methylobacterium radiotolerans]